MVKGCNSTVLHLARSMDSVVFRYLNEDREVVIAIGSYAFYKEKMKTAKQLISVVGWKQTEEQWYNMVELEQEELYEMLNLIMDTCILKVEHVC